MNADLPAEVVTRIALLDRLRDGAHTAGELDAALDVSRATVHRATASLVDQGLLTEGEDGYALTGFGVAVAEEVRAFRANVTTADRLAPFLDAVDPEMATEIPLERFVDARVVKSEPRRAHADVERIRELLADSESFRLFSRVASPVYVDAACCAAVDGRRVDAVFDPEAVEILFNSYADRLREAAAVGDLTVRVYDGCPFELFVFDRAVGVTAHDGQGVQHAFVETDDPAAHEWAERLFDRYVDRAELVTVF